MILVYSLGILSQNLAILTVEMRSSCPITEDQRTEFENYVVAPLTTQPVRPLIVTDADGEKFSFLFVHQAYLGNQERARSMMKKALKCTQCATSFGDLHNVSDQDGSIWKKLETTPLHYCHHDALVAMGRLANFAVEMPITDLLLLQTLTVRNDVEESGGFSHIVRTVSPTDITTCKNDERNALIKHCVERYVTSGLFCRFMDRLNRQDLHSLNLMKTCLDKAAYGHIFLPAVLWCEAILTDFKSRSKPWCWFSPKEKIAFALHHIIRGNLAKDSSGCVSLLFQTAYGNIIDLLEDAKSEDAMTKLCADRLNPENYQRRTAEATPQQVLNAIKSLGDFTNCIMTKEQAEKLIPEMVTHGIASLTPSEPTSMEPTSSMTGFMAQMAKAKQTHLSSFASRCATPSFASRCDKSSQDVDILSIKTLRDFVKVTRKNPNWKVEIESGRHSVAYVASTTLGNKIIHRHPWAFMTNSSSFCGLQSWNEVVSTIPMYEYIEGHKNALFVIKNFRPTTQLGNCCFPEFLIPEFRRTCGPAFEGLNRTTKITVPDGPIMVGLGVSAKDLYGTLMTPINLRVNGIPITLTHL